MKVLTTQIKKLSQKGLNGAEIGRELDTSYWIVRRILAEWAEEHIRSNPLVKAVDKRPDISPQKEVYIPVAIRMINWDLFTPYAIGLLQNPHASQEDKDKVSRVLTEGASFLSQISK